jgi:hypothetical protein
MNDIPLKDAILAWNFYDPKTNKIGDFQVFRFGESIPNTLECTAGAVYASWRRLKPKIRMQLFINKLFGIALSSRAPIHHIRERIVVIPEVREAQKEAGLDQIP